MSRKAHARSMTGAWCQVTFAALLVALLIAGIVIGAASSFDFDTGTVVAYVCGVVAVGSYLPRAITDLVTLRRERRQ